MLTENIHKINLINIQISEEVVLNLCDDAKTVFCVIQFQNIQKFWVIVSNTRNV